ncbi:hypothetical protein GCM10029963_53130 [Micromonospora andamanensis]
MAEISYPHEDYPDVDEGAVTEAEYAGGIGWASPSGLIGSPSDAAPCFLSGGSLWLRANTAARLCGVAYANLDTDLQITGIGSNGGSATRRDHIVVRLDWETMLARHAVITGTAGGALPAVTQQRGSGAFEVSLGELAIPAGGSLANATFTRRGWYLGVDGEYVCTSTSRPPHSLAGGSGKPTPDVRWCPTASGGCWSPRTPSRSCHSSRPTGRRRASTRCAAATARHTSR